MSDKNIGKERNTRGASEILGWASHLVCTSGYVLHSSPPAVCPSRKINVDYINRFPRKRSKGGRSLSSAYLFFQFLCQQIFYTDSCPPAMISIFQGSLFYWNLFLVYNIFSFCDPFRTCGGTSPAITVSESLYFPFWFHRIVPTPFWIVLLHQLLQIWGSVQGHCSAWWRW